MGSCFSKLSSRVPTLRPVRNTGEHGFGRAVTFGLDHIHGDAMVVMMADESDDCRDVVRYWELSTRLGRGFRLALRARRRGHGLSLAQIYSEPASELVSADIFHVPLNDFTNAFKAYRRTAIEGCRPFLSPHFNLTIEIPLKTIVRGYSWTVIPITWRNRRSGFPSSRFGRWAAVICSSPCIAGWGNSSRAATMWPRRDLEPWRTGFLAPPPRTLRGSAIQLRVFVATLLRRVHPVPRYSGRGVGGLPNLIRAGAP